MSPYMALYLKELKANRLVSAVMLVATAVIVVVVVSDASDGALHATLPLPFSPSTPVTQPASKLRLTPRRAGVPR